MYFHSLCGYCADGVCGRMVQTISKETAEELSKSSLCITLPTSYKQEKTKNQMAFWSFSGLTDAGRQIWYRLLKSEYFSFEIQESISSELKGIIRD